MVVVLDSNVWLKELALNSGLGSALRFYLLHRSARLAVPEVVQLEVQTHLRDTLVAAVADVQAGHRTLLALFGTLKELVLPSESEIESLVSGVFERLGIDVIQIPLTLDSSRDALLKLLRKVAPCDKGQQFKDAVLWSDCVRLLDSNDVILATGDKAFFANRSYDQGLAVNLREEVEGKGHRLVIVPSINHILEHVRTDVDIPFDWLVKELRSRAHGDVDGLLSRTGFAIAGEAQLELELFVTENPACLYFTYDMWLPCTDAWDGGRQNAVLRLRGSGTLTVHPLELVEARTGEEAVTFTGADGIDGSIRSVYGQGYGVIGHRSVEHTVRFPISGPDYQP